MTTCDTCDREIPSPRYNQRFCRDKCRWAFHDATGDDLFEVEGGDPAHGHHVVPTAPTIVGDEWSYHWRCTGCGETWPQPLDVAELEDVECEAESERRVA